MLRKTLIAASAAAFLAVPAAAVAAPGDLDPTFGGGTVLDATSFVANDVVVTPDGGAVIASENGLLVKRAADGTRDASFGGGVVQLPDFEDIRSLSLDAQGRILAASSEQVARVRADGTLDPTWGTDADGHVVTVALGEPDTTDIRAVAAAPDGTVLVAGSTFDTDRNRAAVARLTAAGAPDPAFSGDGRQVFGPAADARANDVIPDGFGGMYLVGQALPDSFVVHLRGDGLGDPFFGTNGQVELHLGAPDDNTVLRHVTLTGDRRLVAAGLWADAAFLDGDGLVASLSADGGTPTPGFGDGGLQTVDLDAEGFDELYDVAASIDGDVIVAGTIGFAGDRDAVIGRVRGADGGLDAGFGTGGVVTHVPPSGGAVFRGVTRDAFGAITAAGTSRDDIVAVRVADRGFTPRPDTQPDTPPAGGGGVVTPPPSGGNVVPPPVEEPSKDPVVVPPDGPRVHRPAAWFHRVRSTLRLNGEADQGAARVQVSITRRSGTRCAAVTSTRRARLASPKACRAGATRWLPARITPRKGKTTTWTLRLGARLPAGQYTATVRALDMEAIAGKTGQVSFRVR